MAGLFKRTARSWIYKHVSAKQSRQPAWTPPARQRPAKAKTKGGRQK